jgi:Uma2 family endonuclease
LKRASRLTAADGSAAKSSRRINASLPSKASATSTRTSSSRAAVFKSRQGRAVLANPQIVVEVLSRSTEAYDRGGKWDAYQRIPSLTDYLLVSQTAAQIEHYQRQADGSWRYCRFEAGGIVVLTNGASRAVAAG